MNYFEESASDVSPKNKKYTFMTFLFLIRQNKRLFTIIFLVVWLLSSTYSYLSYAPSYVSSGMVMIKDTALTAKYVTTDNYEMTAAQSTSSVMNTMGLLKTNIFMDELWNYFSLKHPQDLKKNKVHNYQDWEKFFGNGSKYIKYANLPGTDLINMEFKWDNPIIAKEGLEIIIETFRRESLNVNQTEQRERSRYLSLRIQEIQQQLAEIREQSSQFKAKHGIVNPVEETANLTKAKLEIQTNLAMTKAEAMGKASQVSGYRKLLGMTTKDALRATGLGRNETLTKLRAELYAAESEKATLLTKYTEQSVKVQEVNNHISELQKNIDTEIVRSSGTAGSIQTAAFADETRGQAVGNMVNATTEAQQLSSKNRILGYYLQELKARGRVLPKIEAILANYQLEENALNDSLKTLKEKELDAKLKESQSLSNVFLVDAQRIHLDASFPRLPHLLIFDLLLGIFAAILTIVVTSKNTDYSFNTKSSVQSEEIQKLLNTNGYTSSQHLAAGNS